MRKNEEKVIMKNNVLVKARYNISLIENRIFLLMLYKLQRENEGVLKCSITHDEFKRIIKFKEKNTVKGILEILEELRRKPIFFREHKENKKNTLWGAYGFINGYYYDDELGSFTIEASEKIHTLLKQYLSMGYTPVNAQVWFMLNNSYSQRFYDLLRLWSGTKTVITYSISELKELLMLEDKYSRYNDFKKRVIHPAIDELNKSGYFEIEYHEKKVGRKVEAIDFTVKDLDKRIYFDNLENKEIVNLDNTIFDKTIKHKFEKKDDFYVPNKKLFTKKTLDLFKSDFKKYDFNDNKIKNMFYESIGSTLEKDDEEKIYTKSYNYFKKVLSSKLNSLLDNEPCMTFKKNKFHNFYETYTNYSEDELDDIIQKSQREKYKNKA